MVIELKNGRLTLQGETLFAGLSLRAKEGEVVFVDSLPQQAHTPLMHALMGLLPLDEGFVSIDGEVLSERSAHWLRRFIAYVPRTLRWPDDERFRNMTHQEVHRLLLENAASGDTPIVLVDGINGADDEELCLRMAQNGRTVVACRDPRPSVDGSASEAHPASSTT